QLREAIAVSPDLLEKASSDRSELRHELDHAKEAAEEERVHHLGERRAWEERIAGIRKQLGQVEVQAASDRQDAQLQIADMISATALERARFLDEQHVFECRIADVTARLEQVEADASNDREQAEHKSRDELEKLNQQKAQLNREKEILEGVVDAIQQRLESANQEVERQTDMRIASEGRTALLETENERMKKNSQEFARERNELKHLTDEHIGLINTLKLEVGALSSIVDEQRRQAERRVQNLAMEHQEQMLAQHETYRALEADMARLQEEMLNLIREGEEREHQADTQFESVRSSLQHQIARLSEEYGASNAKNAHLDQELALLRAQLEAADVNAAHRMRQVDDLQAEIQHVRAQAESLRDQSHALVAQQVALRDSLSLTESESAARAARADAALSRYWHLLGQNSAQLKGPSALIKLSKMNRKFKLMREHRDVISQFIEKFSETELSCSRSGRKQRITQYLLGVTSDIEDFPLFNRDVYLHLNPDVAEASVEPFIHFIENGQWESRIIHPLMDIPYYVSKYPEVDKFKISAIEHFFKYGVSKGYDPSPLFDTKWYFQQYADVKLIGINPVIHYLRHPGCQPHPDFESDYYRKQNLDVVRQGTNPVVHYALWGRSEGRRPKFQVHAPVASWASGLSSATPDKQMPLEPQALISSAPSGDDTGVQALTAIPSVVASKPLAVMMDAFYPRPDEDSGSLDQVNFIRIFQNLGYDVAFIALLNFGDSPEVGAKISALGAYCVTSSEFSSVEEYLFLNQERISTMFLSRVHFGGPWIERAKAFCPKARILFNTVDLHHIREEREAVLRGDADGVKRAEETKRLEYACIMAADASIVVSDHEQKLLADELPSAKVAVVPLMREIPRTTFPAWHNRQHLAFIGGFQHQPNIDAVNYFLDEIWPIVHARRPDLKFHVIGSHLTDELKARQEPNVEWVGYVPQIEPWLDKLRLTVAPLRYGAGAKGKVVSSLLNGVPCIATTVAAEGMGLRIGDDIVACPNPESFADAILRVHDDIGVWTNLSTNGFDAISRKYSIEYAQKRLETLL
ncbi:MAG: glycosyltransferase, partial [Anaerolineales bacterium]